MLRTRTFEPNDLLAFVPEQQQEDEYEVFIQELGRFGIDAFHNQSAGLFAYSVVDDDTGEVMAIGGSQPYSSGNYIFWSFISAFTKTQEWPSIARAGKRIIDGLIYNGAKRVEVTVKEGYNEAVRLVEMIGFEKEGLLRKYGPNGENYLMYSRVS